MRDPLSWSIPLVRLFGITVRIHILFLILAAGIILRESFPSDPNPVAGRGWNAAVLMGILFASVLLHELGHCVGARLVDGEVQEILLWPLGGLVSVEVANKPRDYFIATIMGPAVNLFLCLMTAMLILWATQFKAHPPWNPLSTSIYHLTDNGGSPLVDLPRWGGGDPYQSDNWGVALLARIFWVNWVLLLINTCLLAFPLDGGRLLQAILWPWFGYRQATYYAIVAGFTFMLAVFIAAVAFNDLIPLILGLFIYLACRHQWILLEMGGEDSVFGYDFSEGYTSLEGDVPSRRRQRGNFWQRWLERRAAQKLKRSREERDAEERRMDQLLEKIQHHGQPSLTEEERRFLMRVSHRYRNRH